MPTAEMIVQGLKEQTPPVIVAERYGCIRVSPGIFTTDVDVVMAAVHRGSIGIELDVYHHIMIHMPK